MRHSLIRNAMIGMILILVVTLVNVGQARENHNFLKSFAGSINKFKATLWFTFIVLLLLGAFGLWLFVERIRLPYNELGRYFDPKDMVVYDSGAVIGYGFLAFLALVLAFIIYRIIRRRVRRDSI